MQPSLAVAPDAERTDFAAFVSARSGRLFRVAYLLTHDRAQAEDLLQTALMRAWSAWRRIEGDPEPYIRRILINTYAAWWRRKWTGEVPSASLPEVRAADANGPVDDRDEMRRALLRLPRQQRAVLVLRYYEDMSEAEIAETMGISPGTVKSHTHKALNNLRLDPGLTGFENPDRLAQVNARIRHRRQRRLATVGAACAVAVAILIGYALAPAHRSAPQPVGPTPSPSPSLVAPVRLNLGSFTEYEVGTRKVTTGRVPGKGSLRLTWTWDGKPLRVFANCHAKKDTDFYLSAKLGDLTLPHPPTCADGPTVRGTGPAFVSAEDAARTHLLVGEQAELIVTLAKVERATKTVELPADAWIEVGVGVSVDWADYKFPPRPSTLLTPKGTGFDQPLDVHSDPADPMRPVSFDVVWGARRSMRTFQASPGLLHVSFNGVEVRTLAAWDYLGSADAHFSIGEGTPGLGDHPPAKGSHVTVTITPEHVTDPWGLWMGPGDALANK